MEKSLHYIGTVKDQYHILMITKSESTESSDGRISMPSDHVFRYKISTENMSIVNGWDISTYIKYGVNIRQSNCPRIKLSSKQKIYSIPANAKVKSICNPKHNDTDQK